MRWTWAAWLLMGQIASAQGPFAEPGTLSRPGVEVRVSPSYRWATRDDFSRPVFLFARPTARVEASELRTDLRLKLSIVADLAVQLTVPLTYRHARVVTQGLVVSADQVLPPQQHTLRSFGLGNSGLAASYRIHPLEDLEVYGDLGTRIPLDDNPGSSTFPTRFPLGAGQSEFFAGLGAHLGLGRTTVGLAYHYSYFPGNTASYLIRRVGNQSYTNGSLSAFEHHRIGGLLQLDPNAHFRLRLWPTYTARVVPLLNNRSGVVALQRERWLHELGFRLELGVRVGTHSWLQLHYSQPVIESWTLDPLFPLIMPDQGVGLAWQITDY